MYQNTVSRLNTLLTISTDIETYRVLYCKIHYFYIWSTFKIQSLSLSLKSLINSVDCSWTQNIHFGSEMKRKLNTINLVRTHYVKIKKNSYISLSKCKEENTKDKPRHHRFIINKDWESQSFKLSFSTFHRRSQREGFDLLTYSKGRQRPGSETMCIYV